MLWTGDINADFLRGTSHTRTVFDAVADLNLTKAWERFDIDFTHCHELLGTSHTSILDHFFWNETLDSGVVDAGVIHLPDNRSDHSPIYCVIQTEAIQQESSRAAPRKSKPSWKRASPEQKAGFKELLEEKLTLLMTPHSVMDCKNTKCKDINHKQDMDQFTLDLLESVQYTAELSLPIPSSSSGSGDDIEKKSIPGWSEQVKPLKDQAYFWHQV